MASKTTKVVTQIAAEVTGAKDIAELGDQIGQLPDDTKPQVAAQVTGSADVDGLARQLQALPANTDPKVAATVTGDADVTGLATDLAGLPASTSTAVRASVSGAADVATLGSDLDGLPASTTPKVAATVTGDAKVDALVSKLQAVPESQTFTVTANIKETGQKGGIKQVGKDIDEVKGKAGKLGVEGGAFAAQFLGPFSDSIGLFGDLGEQLSNIGEEAGENGAGGKLKALGKIGAGVGLAIVGGLLVDTIIGDFQAIQAAQAEVAGVTQSLTQTLIDNGDAWDENAQRALIAQVSQTTAFKNLSAAGIDYATIMDGLTGQAGGLDKLAQAAIDSGNKAAIESLKEARGLSKVGANSRQAAKDALDYAKARGLLTDAQKDGLGIAKSDTAAIGDTGDAADTAATQVDQATQAAKGYQDQPIDPKSVAITADTSSAQRDINAVARQKIPAKVATITGNATSARNTIDGINRAKIAPKEATITAHAEGTEDAQRDIEDIAGKKYEAKIHVKLTADVITEGRWNVTITPRGVGQSAGVDGAPAGFAGGGLQAAEAPSAASFVVRPASSAAGATYSITIQGAVDKDATARALDKILRSRARRIGATRLGRSA